VKSPLLTTFGIALVAFLESLPDARE